MHTISVQQPINLKVVRFELDFTSLVNAKPVSQKRPKKIRIPKINNKRISPIPPPPLIRNASQKRDVKDLIEELLDELYTDQRDWGNQSTIDGSRGSTSAASLTSCQSNCGDRPDAIECSYLEELDLDELCEQKLEWEERLQESGERLAKHVRYRDRLRRQQKRLCAAFTVLLRHITGESGARFGVTPGGGEGPGEGGYAEWLHAMRLVARLPAGVPQHFRKKLWITLSNRHMTSRGIDWPSAERACFRGTAQPDDTELGAQILKDLHRTGCSLFCGTEGRENQAMLRRVLLAYARWNKDVGYCQGFNMLAAIILEVMDKSESDSLKVMIYLVEAVLPEGYFADDLRGLSADMAAFRDLLRLRLPRLAQHMDHLQRVSDGGGVEPPLPDVFTMQWFLTLYATWLPREFLLRIWDLVLLDGNEVLLLTALAIWDMLQDRILSARSADEFYSCMGGGAGAVWEAGDSLVARVVAFGSAPELPRLRSLHRYRVAPPAPPTSAPIYHPPLHSAVQSMTKRGLRLFYSEDEGDSSDDGNKMALATVISRREDRLAAGDRLSLDIGALKRQYARLRERQRQAHVILAAACARHAAVGVSTSPTSLTVNNLLLGKSAIVSSRGRRLGPPPGAIPPTRQTPTLDKQEPQSQDNLSETISWNEEKSRKTLSRRNSVKWKDIKKEKVKHKERRPSIDFDEAGDGIIVSEVEAREMVASVRSRSSSETSSYSSHSASSTDTSLCDENERGSESETELPEDDKEKNKLNAKNSKFLKSPILKETKISTSPTIKPTIKKSHMTCTPEIEVSSSPVEKPIAKDVADYLDSSSPVEKSIAKDIADYLDTSSPVEKSIAKDIADYLDSSSPVQKPIAKEIAGYLDASSPVEKSITRDIADYLHSSSPVEKSIAKDIADSLDSSSPVEKSIAKDIADYLNSSSPIEKPIARDIADYLDSAAGEPLRTYIDGFETKLKDSLIVKSEPTFKLDLTAVSPCSPRITTERSEVLQRLNRTPYEENSRSRELIRPTSFTKSPKNFTELSPIDLSPCNCTNDHMSPYDFNFETNFKRPLAHELPVYRPPDIIDSFTMYPNFVPDIDLSDKNISDIDSPPRSPGGESIIVSEDEPPIPLKIDKYFEHSPEFFGARVTDPNSIDIPNRRATKRLSRLPKKPDSLTLQSNHNEKLLTDEFERASSLPQSHSFANKIVLDDYKESKDLFSSPKQKTPDIIKTQKDSFSPKDYILQTGRKNSEKALQIIQENSKILSRILTKQHTNGVNSTSTKYQVTKSDENVLEKQRSIYTKPIPEKPVETKLIDSPLLRESTSDSLIGYRKRHGNETATENNDFLRIRPISIDDPFSLEIRNTGTRSDEFSIKSTKSPSSECLGNRPDIYGWENKGFLAKSLIEKSDNFEYDYRRKASDLSSYGDISNKELQPVTTSDWTRHSFSGESKPSVTLPSTEPKDTSTYERRFTSDDYNYPLSSKYNDFVLSKASDICSKTVNQGPKICENLSKTDNSQVSDFAHVVTSSISFTYEPSVEDDSPTGAKSNSSDTLCQITSLDQVSTPISPKIFPNRDTPTMPKDYSEKSDRTKVESDDTCSAITSLIETDTLSSLSYPRSPSTGSYHPFPTRPVLRMPKELGVRLGMYPKDVISSPPK